MPLTQIEWLNDFYSLPSDYKLSGNKYYENGDICGLDISSGLSVNALEIHKDDQILDICCAPGGKLIYIADIIGQEGTGIVTGVDLSENRLSICKSLIRKYNHNRFRLFCADGTTFDVRPPSRVGGVMLDPLVEMNSKSDNFLNPFHATKLVRNDNQHGEQFYDKVNI